MSTVLAHNRASVLSGVLADDSTNLSVQVSGANELTGKLEAFIRGPEKVDTLLVALSNEEGLVQVSMKSILVNRDVKVHNITFLDGAAIRDSVANDLVGRNAHGLLEVVVVERTRVCATLHAGLVHNAVNLITGDASTHKPRRNVEDLAANLAYLAHLLDLLSRCHRDSACFGSHLHTSLKLRGTRIGVVRLLDVIFGLHLLRNERRSKRPREGIPVEEIRCGKTGFFINAIDLALGLFEPFVAHCKEVFVAHGPNGVCESSLLSCRFGLLLLLLVLLLLVLAVVFTMVVVLIVVFVLRSGGVLVQGFRAVLILLLRLGRRRGRGGLVRGAHLGFANLWIRKESP
mmetsp:Transcript_8056/g.16006  ORF Transcript_8056/g.16006 Transcript_8056/m.16006 type:complete len:345 (-) Transcript_8056:153-1187(-)